MELLTSTPPYSISNESVCFMALPENHAEEKPLRKHSAVRVNRKYSIKTTVENKYVLC